MCHIVRFLLWNNQRLKHLEWEHFIVTFFSTLHSRNFRCSLSSVIRLDSEVVFSTDVTAADPAKHEEILTGFENKRKKEASDRTETQNQKHVTSLLAEEIYWDFDLWRPLPLISFVFTDEGTTVHIFCWKYSAALSAVFFEYANQVSLSQMKESDLFWYSIVGSGYVLLSCFRIV